MHQKKIIEQIKAVATQYMPQAEVFLFGSRARSTAKPHSDWDLLVLLNTPAASFDIETEVMDWFYELELKTGAVICPLIYTKTQWYQQRANTPLFKNIEKEGIRLQ